MTTDEDMARIRVIALAFRKLCQIYEKSIAVKVVAEVSKFVPRRESVR